MCRSLTAYCCFYLAFFERFTRLAPLDDHIEDSYHVGMRFPDSFSDDRLRAAFAMRPGLAARLFRAVELDRIHAVADLDADVTISDFAGADPGLLATLDVLVTG